MPHVPFRCPRCNLVFGEGGIHIEGDVSELSLSGNTMSCPNCGTMSPMALAEGTYNVREGRFEFVRSLAATFFRANAGWSDIELLRELVEQARNDVAVASQVADAIATQTPQFAELAEALRNQRPDRLTQALTAVAVLIAVLAWLFPRGGKSDSAPSLTPQQVEQVITQTVDRLSPPAGDAPARSAPCPCGSGRKYKRCHGANRR